MVVVRDGENGVQAMLREGKDELESLGEEVGVEKGGQGGRVRGYEAVEDQGGEGPATRQGNQEEAFGQVV